MEEIKNLVDGAEPEKRDLLRTFVNELSQVLNNVDDDYQIPEMQNGDLNVNEDDVHPEDSYRLDSMLQHHARSKPPEELPLASYKRDPFLDHDEFKGVLEGRACATATGMTRASERPDSNAENRPATVGGKQPHEKALIKPLGGSRPLELAQPKGIPAKQVVTMDKPKPSRLPEERERERLAEIRKLISSKDSGTRSVLEERYRPKTSSNEILVAIHDYTADRLKTRADQSRDGQDRKFEDTLRLNDQVEVPKFGEDIFETQKQRMIMNLLKDMDNSDLQKLQKIIASGGMKTVKPSHRQPILPVNPAIPFMNVAKRKPTEFVIHQEFCSELLESTHKPSGPPVYQSGSTRADGLLP